jgi:hypothetical protein
VPLGSGLSAADGEASRRASVASGSVQLPILSEYAGKVDHRDFILGVTSARKRTRRRAWRIGDPGAQEEIHPSCSSAIGGSQEDLASYTMPPGARRRRKGRRRLRRRGRRQDAPQAGAHEGHHRRSARVSELFEARKRRCAETPRSTVRRDGGNARGRRKLLVRDPIPATRGTLIPLNKHIVVYAAPA